MIALRHAGAVRAARRLVAQACHDAATGPECASTAALLTSELVTNALLHGTGRVRLGIDAGEQLVRIEVGDDDPRHPCAPTQRDGAESGRGLLILDELAASWGVCDSPPGKVVWFELVAGA